MTALLSPAWLLALAALAVPIVLHLISRGRTRRVTVASIRLLSSNDSRRARWLKPTQLWLLALRCLLLAALALALAEPRGMAIPAPAPDWVLASPSVLRDRADLEPDATLAYAELDRRLADGAELRVLAPGFPLAGSAPPGLDDANDTWSLLAEAGLAAPPRAGFAVFVPDRVDRLRGARPTLDREIAWHAIPLRKAARWVNRHGAGSDGTPVTLVAGSNARRTVFDVEPAQDASVLPDPVGVAIVHEDARAEDARYVRAAVGAAAEHGLRTVRFEDPAAPSEEPLDLLVWLDGKPPPEGWASRVRPGGTIVSDGGPLHEGCAGRLRVGDAAVELRRCSPPAATETGAPVWTDGSGRTVLDAVQVGDATHYRLHGRFHPAWSDLPVDAALPAWFLELIELQVQEGTGDDRRASGGQDAPSARANEPAARVATALPEQLLWLAIAGLLLVERYAASKIRS